MRKKGDTIGFLVICTVCISPLLYTTCFAEKPPIPGPPHRFWGTVTDIYGNPLSDGSKVTAIVDGENYTTTVVNGTYGWYTVFYVEDPNNDNAGKTIYFFVDNESTGETAVFEPLGFTQLNLTVDIETNNGEGSNEGESPIPPPDGNNNEVQEPIPPVACIGGPYIGFVNKTVIFNASQSYDLDGVIVSYSWNFGDNTTGSGVTPSHTYVSKGIYVITLKVTDDSGLFDTNETTITIMFDSDGDGWGDREEEQYGTNASDPMDYPLDTDHDRLPDTVDNDDDNDGLPDEIEEQLGSNETNPADVIKIKINNITYYLVDIDSDDMSDIFYDIANEIITQVNVTERGTYLIDVDGDGSWDYEYNSADGNVLFIKKGENKNNLLLLLGVVLALVVIIAVILLLIVKKVLKKKGGKGGK